MGKTTFAREFLPNYADCRNFVNADLIAAGLSPFSPQSAAFRAGRLVLEEIEHLASHGVDFGFESTLSGRGHLGVIHRLTSRGYKVHIYFLWVPTADVTLSRIRDRVLKGGHNVPEVDARRRFTRSIVNFFNNYRTLSDSWILFDTSHAVPSVVASQRHGEIRIIETET